MKDIFIRELTDMAPEEKTKILQELNLELIKAEADKFIFRKIKKAAKSR